MDWQKLLKKTVDEGKKILDEVTGVQNFDHLKFRMYTKEAEEGLFEIWISGCLPEFDGDNGIRINAYDLYGDDKTPKVGYSEEKPFYIYSPIKEQNNPDTGKWGRTLSISNDFSGEALKPFHIANFYPPALVTNYSGNRDIVFRLSYRKADGEWYINKTIYSHKQTFYMPSGAQEEKENLEQIKNLFITIGLAVAFSDGSIDKQESQIVKEYGAMLTGSDLKLKENLNLVIKETYAKYKKLSFDKINSEITTLITKFNEIADTAQKYKLADFCYSLMAADKKADKNELKILDSLKELLDIEDEYFKKLSDQKIVELDSSSVESNLEKILGIDTSWSKEKISKFLATEFQKWSNRLNTLTDEEKKQKAQSMLELIAKARIKYEI